MVRGNPEERSLVPCVCCQSRAYVVLYEDNHGDEAQTAQVASYSISTRRFGQHGRLVRCLQCGMVYMNPRPTEGSLSGFYEQMADELYLSEEPARLATLERVLQDVESFGRGRLLEVGCATGFFLKVARKHGWDVMGVEPSRWAVDYAARYFGMNVVRGTLESISFPDNHFDAIVMLDLIEHLYDPVTTLAEAYRVLRGGGVLVLSTPNVDSVFARCLRGRWWCITDEHLNYFSARTIRLVLGATGFQMVKMRSYPRRFSIGYWLDRIYRWNKHIGGVLSRVVHSLRIEKQLLWLDLHDQMIVTARKAEGRPSC